MIPEYSRKRRLPLDIEEATEGMPEIANAIANTNVWKQYEQAPDFSEIPEEYQSMIPDNAKTQKEDTRTYNIWLTKR
jgi:hypothetical protein